MPRQELFFEKEADGRKIEVLSSYDPQDQQYAREAFGRMNENALQKLQDTRQA